VSSRAKKKHKKHAPHEREREPSDVSPSLEWEGEEGIPLTKKQERWLDMFFGGLLGFILAGVGSFVLLESWKISAVFAVVAAVIGARLVQKGVDLFS
jgi:hypothetical protein